MNMFKFVRCSKKKFESSRCSKNDVWVRSIFTNMVFNPLALQNTIWTVLFIVRFDSGLHFSAVREEGERKELFYYHVCGVCDSRGMSSTVFSCQESARGSGQNCNYTVLCDDDVNAWWSRNWWKMWYFSWKYVVKFSEWLRWLKLYERWISGCTWKITQTIIKV